MQLNKRKVKPKGNTVNKNKWVAVQRDKIRGKGSNAGAMLK